MAVATFSAQARLPARNTYEYSDSERKESAGRENRYVPLLGKGGAVRFRIFGFRQTKTDSLRLQKRGNCR